jgi:hypothetical protein
VTRTDTETSWKDPWDESPTADGRAEPRSANRVRSGAQFQIKTLMIGVFISAIWLTLLRDVGMRTMMVVIAVSLGLMLTLIVALLGLGWLGFLVFAAVDWIVTGLKRAWRWEDSQDKPFGP